MDGLQCTRCDVVMRAVPVGGVTLCPACGQAHVLALIPFSLSLAAPRAQGAPVAPPVVAAKAPAAAVPRAIEPVRAPPVVPAPAVAPVKGPPWPPGALVLVSWNDKLLEAVIVREDGPELWEVTYPEWDGNFNEVVGPDRIRPRPVTREVTAETPLTPGDRVQAFWETKWYDAEILELEAGGLIRVHFLQYDDTWDRSVRRDELRLVVG